MNKGDIVRNPNSGRYAVYQSRVYYTNSAIVKPLDDKYGLPTIKSRTTWDYCEVVPKKELQQKLEQMEIEKMDKLYEFKVDGKTVYGHKLAVNQAGLWVMDIKGGGAPVAVKPEDAKEVITYSIEVQDLQSGEKTHYMAQKDKYNVGEIYFMMGGSGIRFATVTRVDTETRATREFKATRKILTEEV